MKRLRLARKAETDQRDEGSPSRPVEDVLPAVRKVLVGAKTRC